MQDDLDWAAYYDWQAGREVRATLTRALTTYGEVTPGDVAVELGCGAGIETRALLAAGFIVTAVDADPASAAGLDDDRLTVQRVPMQEASLPSANLLYAGFSLPFCPPEEFDGLWTRVREALAPGGLLAVDLFGERDSWAGEAGMTFVSRSRVDELLDGLEVVLVEEEDADGKAYAGPKHWHRFEVLARRP